MRVLVTGVKGQLGHDVMDELAAKGIEGIGVDVEEMDITDADACQRVIKEAKPDAVIHWCSIYCSRCGGRQCGAVPEGQCRRNQKYCKGLQRAGYQDDVHQYRLCV